ncbi:MAG: dCMP deaminase family protein [Candidatus Sericytochromatia bacterium]|nr:dCMP deaminase family protein [Candidatus Sericytochromatia bacterium]
MKRRPTWDTYFLKMAGVCAERATCDRKSVGAVIVRDNHPIATGYNGAPPGLPHCDEVGHLLREVDGRPSCQRATHAEQNAIITAARFGHRTEGATIYVTAQPCLNCAKAIITAGIRRVVWTEGYPDPVSLEFLRAADIELVHVVSADESHSSPSSLSAG